MAAAALLLMAWVSSSHSGGVERSEYIGGPRSEEAYREMFAEFLTKFGKTYDVMFEQERRYAAFKDSIKTADKLAFSLYYTNLYLDGLELPTRSHEETWKMFNDWVAIHGKTYDSHTEFARRFIRFKINLVRVHKHNNAAFVSFSPYRLSLDRFADLHYHEFLTRCQEPTMEQEECSTTTLWA
ncbi:hypothetical protein ZWY2020_046322 [Hordeum vulgare]|nr:hypothetical protein ZWY2020_046322 [Hordeum vulgare]